MSTNNENTNIPTISGDLYDYESAVRADLEQWVEDYGNKDVSGLRALVLEYDGDADEIRQYLEDTCMMSDCVTGNASGSYWCSSYRAQCALIGNIDLLGEAVDEFCYEGDSLKELMLSPESADVVIRCYLLGRVVYEYMQEHEDEIEEIREEIEAAAMQEISEALEEAAQDVPQEA